MLYISRRRSSHNQPAVEALENRRLLSTTFLSDLDPVSVTSPYSGFREDLATNGTPLEINGQTWTKGLGTHSTSEVIYNLNGEYNRFESYVGIDDFVGDGPGDGSAVFEVWGDNVLLASSSRLTGADDAEFISADITGVKELRLVTTTGGLPGDNDYKDHTNWADAWVFTNDEHVPTHLTLEAIQPIATDSQDAIVRVNRIGRTDTTVLLRVNAGTVFSAFLYSDEPYVDIPVPADLFPPSGEMAVSLAPSNEYIVDSEPVKVFREEAAVLPHLSMEVIEPLATDSQDAVVRITRSGDTTDNLLVRVDAGTPFSVFIDGGESFVDVPIPADLFGAANELTVSIIPDSAGYVVDGDPVTVFYDAGTSESDVVYLSDLTPTSATSPYGGLKKDASHSGNPLTVGGETWTKGLGTHSTSELIYNLGGQYTRFESYVGIDDFVGNGSGDGSAVFEVWGDGNLLDSSPRLTGADGAAFLSVDVTGVKELRLVTTTGGLPGDNDYKDHTDWADAKLLKAGEGVELPHLTLEVIESTATDSQDAIVRITRSGDTTDNLQVRVNAGTPFSVFIDANESFVDVPIPADLFGAANELTVSIIPDSAAYVIDGDSVKVFREEAVELPHLSLDVVESTATETQDAVVRVTRTGDTDNQLLVRINAGTIFSVFIEAGESSVDVPIPEDLFGASSELTVSIAADSLYVVDGDPVKVFYEGDSGSSEQVVYLSDLTPVSANSPYYGLKKDQAANGTPLQINGQTWEKGLGTHSASEVVFNLNGQYSRFEAYVGIDDFVGDGASDGSAVFQVWGDGQLLADSRRLTGADDAQFLTADLEGVDELVLVTTTGGLPGDNDYKDHTNWADAKLFSDEVIA